MSGPCVQRQRGFSLVEIAVALLIAGLVSAAVFTLIPIGGQVLKADHDERLLAQAEQALLGHARAKLRLPAADSDGDGRPDPGSTSGWLPVRELGLPGDARILYSAHAALLAAPGNVYAPHLAGTEVSSPTNGLDLCLHLQQVQANGTPLAGLSMPAAYALGMPNERGQVGDAQAAARALALPGAAPVAGSLPGLTLAAGVGELSSRLACADRLGRAQGAAQSAAAAYSIAEVAQFNYRFRKFDVRTNEALLKAAETGVAAAAASLAFAIFDEAIAVFLTTTGNFETGFKIALAVMEHANALASVGYAVFLVKMADDDLKGARESLATAKDIAARASTRNDLAAHARDQALQQAKALDIAGIDK
jgi:prepilin-type N-terminal cleavage/methylation domain-containing protein